MRYTSLFTTYIIEVIMSSVFIFFVYAVINKKMEVDLC